MKLALAVAALWAYPEPCLGTGSWACATQDKKPDLKPAWVDTELEVPERYDPKREDMAEPHGGGYMLMSKGSGGDPTTRVIVPGKVAVHNDLIEVFMCAEGGKDYESAITTTCDVQQLDLALVLSGARKGKAREVQGVPTQGEGTRLLVFVQWKQKDGTVRTCRAEDLIHDLANRRRMPRVGWTYIGSWEEEIDPNTGDRTGTKFLIAARTKSLLATFSDPGALLDNPIVSLRSDDTAYQSNGLGLPPAGTPVKVIFRRATAGEIKEIERIEQALAKEKPRKRDE